MPNPFTYTGLSLGVLADIDTSADYTETYVAENAAALIGVTVTPTLEVLNIEEDNVVNRLTHTNDNPPIVEPVVGLINGVVVDHVAIFNVDVVHVPPGGPQTTSNIAVQLIQTVNGNAYLADLGDALDDLGKIKTITFTSYVSSPIFTDFNNIIQNTSVVCFAAGTMISAAGGETPVQSLRVGDRVQTRDNGLQTIRWIGRRTVSAPELRQAPKLRPVRISAGALGDGMPKRDLLVSRQHRMLIHSKIAERMFDSAEVLVSAIKLCALPGIFVDEEADGVDYIHILFNRHEVIYAQGAPTESLFTGPEALKAMPPEAWDEIQAIFPEFSEGDYRPSSARYRPEGKEQKHLIARLLKNRVDCVDGAAHGGSHMA